MNKKVGIVSLGCDKNLVDSENILGLFAHNGYETTNDPKDSDIIVINTCGFIESSKKESIETILEMISYGKKIVVTGCLVERYLEELKKELPEVDKFIPIRDYKLFNKHLAVLDPTVDENLGVCEEYRILSTGPYSAYIKIGEGCDNRCSYCAIPLIRGRFVSRKFDSIINEAKSLASKGIKELIVLEQDTTKYGIDFKDEKHNIVDLLKALLEIKEFDYIRLLYLYPDEISDELIDIIGKEPRLTPYFDIPIQHSETGVLKRMNRRGDKDFLKELFTKIRSRVPNAILRTTILVGFPGETEEDVDNLIEFIKEIKFDHLGCFTYSLEEGTLSATFTDQIDEQTKQNRKDRVMKAQQKISYSQNKKHINEVMEGLVCGQENNLYTLRSYYNAPDDIDGKIYFSSDTKLKIGEKVKVKITDAFVYDLMGVLVK